MTLTLATAKHAVGKYGEISDIVDDVNCLTHRSVTREAAIEATELGYKFTPCIVVTTAREALEAAWELAYETNSIPARTPYIFRAPGIDIQTYKGQPCEMHTGHGMSRLIDPPEPEPWEQSRYCHADGLFLERKKDEHGQYWQTVEDIPEVYDHAHLATLNPKPVTIEGDDE